MSTSSATLERVARQQEHVATGPVMGYAHTDIGRAELERLRLFSNADLSVIESLLVNCPIIDLARGDILIADNEANDALYLVLEGRLRVQLDGDEDKLLSMIDTGDCVGELSLIDNKPASARVIADSDARVLKVDQDTFWAMIRASHAVACNLLMNIGRRLQNGNSLVAENQQLQQVYLQQAMTDSLTGLYNRRWLENALSRQVSRSSISERPLALILLDIDHFGAFNDEFGHIAGDHALFAVSQVLMNSVRPTDLVARYGGQQFAVVLPDSDANGARLVAERVREAVSEAVIIMFDESILPSLTVSLGISETRDGSTAEELLADADAALRRAKKKGRNSTSA